MVTTDLKAKILDTIRERGLAEIHHHAEEHFRVFGRDWLQAMEKFWQVAPIVILYSEIEKIKDELQSDPLESWLDYEFETLYAAWLERRGKVGAS